MDDPTYPEYSVGGVDYPRTMQEFDKWFPDESACAVYLLRLHWPRGFICPSCGVAKGWLSARQQLRCAGCQRQTSVTAETIFEGTRKPLRIWFLAVWHVTDVSGDSLIGFIQQVVSPGSIILTDGWKGYASLGRHGYTQ